MFIFYYLIYKEKNNYIMILIPIGTKAQLVKMAPVILAMKKQLVPFHFVLTGQHSETMNDLIIAFGLPQPDYTLVQVSEANTSLKLLKWLCIIVKRHLFINSEITKHHYQVCLVHGDTLSTLVCALIARRYKIKVAHIEAGLRSFNYFHPFPEELVRVIVSKMSQIHFYAGAWAGNNLKKYKNKKTIDIKYNTLIDSVKFALSQKAKDFKFNIPNKFVIVSIHRFENLSNPERLDFIINQVLELQKKIKVLFVLHPATREKLNTIKKTSVLTDSGISLIPRLDYIDFLALLNKSVFIITDGGSNQEECAYLKKPCLLMRKVTERVEGLDDNVVLAKYDSTIISEFIHKYISSDENKLMPNDILDVDSPSDIIASYVKGIN